MKIMVNLKELEGNSYFSKYIEKARKGEQVGGNYIYRENIEEKHSTSGGKEVVRRYKYYYVSDLLKDSAEKILSNIGKFFFKGKSDEVKKIDIAYAKENIEKDYGADKKTWYQHVMEYFSHRDIWDKRFSKKETAEKWKKPVKTNIAEKINVAEMETPTEKAPEIKTNVEKTKKEWKANPSLMRKVWSLYTGKELTKEEKSEKVVSEVINKPENETQDNQTSNEVDEKSKASFEESKEYLDLGVERANKFIQAIKKQIRKKEDRIKNCDSEIRSIKRNMRHEEKDYIEIENHQFEPDSKGDWVGHQIITEDDREKALEYKMFRHLTYEAMLARVEDYKDELKGEHGNRVAMLGNDNAKKYGIMETEAKNGKGRNSGRVLSENNDRVESRGPRNTTREILTGNNQDDGGKNGNETELRDNTNESSISSSEPGERFRNGKLGIGRLGKVAAKKIREQCREILKKNDSEITADDKIILAQYEGAGGLKEGNQTDAAVLSEFYTPRDVIKKVWQIVDKYNPNKNKKVIEPSSGTGRFAENRDENFTLCELDETSARIAHLLHPNAEVKQGAFQNLFVKNNAVIKDYKGEKFDVAVGNPPYGDYSGRYKGMGEGKIHTRYEEYFIDRTLDTLKDDGIMAFVVPSGFLRNASSKAKEAIAKKGKLLEAWRLPKGTFSSTDVGTDIVVLRKEPGNPEDFANNNYFENNTSHVIGYETKTGNFGSTVVNLPEGKTVSDAIEMIDTNSVEVDKQIAHITETVKSKVLEPVKTVKNYAFGDTVETPEGAGKITGFRKEKNKVVAYKVRVNDQAIEILAESDAEEHKNRSDAMKGNDNAKKLIHKEETKKAKQGDLYTPSEGHIMNGNEFCKKYGKDIPDADLKFWEKNNWEGIIEKDSLTESELKEIENNTNFIKTDNGDFVSTVNYASGNIYKILDELESNKDAYSAKDYEFRKSLLNAVLPEKKNIQQITVGVTANFAKSFQDEDGKSLVDKFLYEYCGFSQNGSTYGVKLSKNELEDNMSWRDVWDYVNQIPVVSRSRRGADEADKETDKMIAEQKKMSRRECAERLFNDFLRKLPKEKQEQVEDAWNRQFNTFVNPDFKKIPLFVEGMSTHKGEKEFTLTEQQVKGISEVCNKGNGILAYDVGVGKTACGIVATVNQLETGRAKKPLIMVPKAVYKKWIKEIHQHFPDIAINELGNLGDNYIGKYKNEDGTIDLPTNALNICTYEALQKVTFKEETISGQLRDDMLDSQSVFDYDENGNLVEDTRTDRERAAASEKIEKMLGTSSKAKEGGVFWEDLGIDHITIDELHNFKNIFSIPRNIGKSSRSTNEKKINMWGQVKKQDDDPGRLSNEFQGLSGASSNRGMKLFAISQIIQQENDGKGVVGLSATPFNNSPIEIYNILSLVARNRLKDLQIYNLQDFLREFAELKPDWKVDAKGHTEQIQTMKNFKNLTALQNLITEFIDKVDGEEAGVLRPRKVAHRPTLDLSDLQKKILEAEKKRMDGEFSNGNDGKPTGDVLVAMNNMRMATLSPALIDPKFFADYQKVFSGIKLPKPSEVVESSPKLSFVCETAAMQYKARPTEGQVIYMPRGVEQFKYVKDYLVSKGMPDDSIAFMGSKETNEKKEEIMKDFNSPDGKIKLIIGSETIKEGVSLNGNSTTLYNTMLGWNPTETTQVEGRIWRQGNKQGITHIVYPLMNDSIDSFMMQKYDEKSSRLNALWSYKGDSLNVEDYDPEEVKFALIKDPEERANMKILFESADLKKELRMSNALYDNLYDTKAQYEIKKKQVIEYNENLKDSEKDLEETKAKYESYKADYDKAKKTLASAKKAKDDDLIVMAEGKLKDAEKDVTDYKEYSLDRAKSNVRMYQKTVKELQESVQAIETYLEKQGIESPDKVDSKLEQISEKRQDLQQRIDDLKDRKKEFVEQAKKELEEEAAKISHESVVDVVKQVSNEISSNLRPMDAKMKAELQEELWQQYPNLRKSLPMFFIKDGIFYINKAYKIKL